MTLDWRQLKAVVLESDDWGLCAWVPDEEAHEALAGTPAFRAPAARAYTRSTLERADDVARLAAVLLEFRGADGQPAVWQANTVMATPDYARLVPPRFDCQPFPLLVYPEFPPRWERPGLKAAIERGILAGVWWPELHGLIHLPGAAWLASLRAGSRDALAALQHQCFVCEAVERSAEYDPSEPAEARRGCLRQAVGLFRMLFFRHPESLCAPDYRWDDQLEADAESFGVTIIQGSSERVGRPLRRLRHRFGRLRWHGRRGRRFEMPPRIAFEPRGDARPDARLGVADAHARVRAAWKRGQPAVVSSHRLSYAHLDPAWSEAGRAALRGLLDLLSRDHAVFLTDAEVRSLDERGWSLRTLTDRTSLLRQHGPGPARVRVPAPFGAAAATLREAHDRATPRIEIEESEAVAELAPGTYVVEWTFA